MAAIRAYQRPMSEQLELCRGKGLPVATVMSGGYGRRIEDTVDIHLATVRIAAEMAGGR